MIPVDVDRTVVGLGSRVEVEDDDGEADSYMIVGTPEANPSQGKISNESPVGRALIGLRVGEVATVATPSGQMRYTVREIH
jgi:transcription elongation factor GreA